MNLLRYSNHLLHLLGEEPARAVQDADSFYGLFQSFMPDGTGARDVFESLTCADALYDRLVPLYAATKTVFQKARAEGGVPGYFCPPTPEPLPEKSELEALGWKHVQSMLRLAGFCNDSVTLDLLKEVVNVRVQLPTKSTKGKKSEQRAESKVNEAVYELIHEFNDAGKKVDAEKMELLSEAYYSMCCDYMVSYYLQYPSYTLKPEEELFEAYFQLMLLGATVRLEDTALQITLT